MHLLSKEPDQTAPTHPRAPGPREMRRAFQLTTDKAQDLLSQLVVPASLERWRQPRKGGLRRAHAPSSCDSSSSGNKCLEPERRLPPGGLLPRLVSTQPFLGHNFPGQHWSKSRSLPNIPTWQHIFPDSHLNGPEIEKMMSATAREGQTPSEEGAQWARLPCNYRRVVLT